MLADPDVKDAINETCRILTEAVDSAFSREVPRELIDHLHNDTFLFSGFKTYHEAREISALLLDNETGTFKSFEKFLDEVREINSRYNSNYLQAEYNFAVQSTQMAVKWHDFQHDGDRYLLQYRTANDGLVRPEHQALHNTTLPIDDPFWDSYTPPLGWNCRCTVVQVNRGKYPVSDSAAAIRAGEAATAKPKQQIFRFNPGKTERVFPPRHPYLPKGCGDCQFRTERHLGYKPDNPLCQACDILAKCMNDATIEEHRKAFDELVASGNYTETEFNPLTGAYKAIHIGHISHDNPNEDRYFAERLSATQLEKLCQDSLFNAGHTAILLDEITKATNGNILPALDLQMDGRLMDIRSITENNKHTIRNALYKKNDQIRRYQEATGHTSDTVCLYFYAPSLFNEKRIKKGISEYSKMVGENRRNIKHVVCVVNNESHVFEYDIK